MTEIATFLQDVASEKKTDEMVVDPVLLESFGKHFEIQEKLEDYQAFQKRLQERRDAARTVLENYKQAVNTELPSKTDPTLKRYLTEVTEYWSKDEPKGQRMQREAALYRLEASGVTNPEAFITALSQNLSFESFYAFNEEGDSLEIDRFDYKKITFALAEAFACFEDPAKIVSRLNKLHIKINPDHAQAVGYVHYYGDGLSSDSDDEFDAKVEKLRVLGILDPVSLQDHYGVNKNMLARLKAVNNDKLEVSSPQIETYKLLASFFSESEDDMPFTFNDVFGNPSYLQAAETILLDLLSNRPDGVITAQDIAQIGILRDLSVLVEVGDLLEKGFVFAGHTALKSSSTEDDEPGVSVVDLVSRNHHAENQKFQEMVFDASHTNRTFNAEETLIRTLFGLYTVEQSVSATKILNGIKQLKSTIKSAPFLLIEQWSGQLQDDQESFFHTQSQEGGILHYWNRITEEHEQVFAIQDTQEEKIYSFISDLITSVYEEGPSQFDTRVKAFREKRNTKERHGFKRIKDRLSRERDTNKAKSAEDSATEESVVDTADEGLEKEEFLKAAEIETLSIDRDHVVDQCFDIIFQHDGSLRMQFFITEDQVERLVEASKVDYSSGRARHLPFTFEGTNGDSEELAEALTYEVLPGIEVQVGLLTNTAYSLRGWVDVKVKNEVLDKMNQEELLELLEPTLSYVSGMQKDESVFDLPTEESDQILKKRLCLFNTKSEEPPEGDIVRTVVFGEYETMVNLGRSERLREQFGSFFSYHDVRSDTIVSVLKQGLFSSHERYRRQILKRGMSTTDDFRKGGANYVFLRTLSEHSFFNASGSEVDDFGGMYRIVFDPKIWDRLDFFIYNEDRYGSTRPDVFNDRKSPEEFLKIAKARSISPSNEQMFKRGIPVEMFKAVVVDTIAQQEELIKKLSAEGVTEINGMPLADFILVKDEEENILGTVFDQIENLPRGTTTQRLRRAENPELYLDETPPELDSEGDTETDTDDEIVSTYLPESKIDQKEALPLPDETIHIDVIGKVPAFKPLSEQYHTIEKTFTPESSLWDFPKTASFTDYDFTNEDLLGWDVKKMLTEATIDQLSKIQKAKDEELEVQKEESTEE